MKMQTIFLDSLLGAAGLVAWCVAGGACSSTSAGTSNTTVDPGHDAAAADSAVSRASRVATDGYITAGSWSGYGFTATDLGAATIVPDCSGAAGCMPVFSANDFCMHGTVTGRVDYTGFAMLGWNLNQAAATGATPGTWPVPASGGLTVTVVNTPPSTALRVQLQGTNPHDSADRWCAPLTNGQTIAWTDFKTNCYVGGTPQNALTPGTMLQQGSILVPGLQTDLPFDVCLIDIQM
jgi:hypothetical protein